MKQINFDKMLPDQYGTAFEKAKTESPYTVLLEYSEAINEKYEGKLKAKVTESYQLRTKAGATDESKENLVIALYIEAAIGKGYLYRLLEIEQMKNTTYPVRVKVFQDSPSTLGTFKTHASFIKSIIDFLDSSFVKTFLLNLLAQIDLYNKSMAQKFEWVDGKHPK